MPYSILVHGGAGAIFPDDRARLCAEGCLAAARAGHAILAAGGSALDAVEAAVAVLEDDPVFNAGTGSCLNAEGDVEMDAAIMDGATLEAGAVGAVRAIRNPIRLARLVMDRSPHVLLAAGGAERFARDHGVPAYPPSLLVTERALERWRKEREGEWTNKPGTVGAVALDDHGHVAAATSTGGISGKMVGRIGDTPVIGAGTYADDLAGAVSATGQGERIIRVVLGKFTCDRLAAGEHPQQAAEAAVRELGRVKGEGGLIVVDRLGRLGWACNTSRMSRAAIDAEGQESCGFEP